MCYKHCYKAHIVVGNAENTRNNDEEEHHRHTGNYIGVHHRNVGDRVDGTLQIAVAHTVKTERRDMPIRLETKDIQADNEL